MEDSDKHIVKINFVYSEDESVIKDFLQNIPADSEYINYLEIYSKLSKNDFYQCNPSDSVISSYLIKQLNNHLAKNVLEIYYVVSTVDSRTLSKIQKFISSLSNHKIIFNIYHPSSIYLNGARELFSSSFIF